MHFYQYGRPFEKRTPGVSLPFVIFSMIAIKLFQEYMFFVGVVFINFPAKRKKRGIGEELNIPKHVEYKIRMSVDHTFIPSYGSLFDRLVYINYQFFEG